MGLNLKTRTAKFLSKIVLAHPLFEKIFCYLFSKLWIRKNFRLGAIAIGCTNSLRQPVIRLAKLDRYQIFVSLAELIGTEAYFFKQNNVFPITSHLIREGDSCIDIGANMGSYALYMASRVGKSGHVLAFEPQPFYLDLLRKSATVNNFNDLVEIHETAVWNKTGETLSFYLSTNPNNGGTSSLIDHGVYVDSKHIMQIKTTTLDDFVKTRNLSHFRLVKIDVERAELEVLQGMKNLLSQKKIDFIFLEMYSGSEAQKLLEDFGYRCFLMENEKVIDIARVEKGVFGDYLFQSPQCLDFNPLEPPKT